MRVLRLSRMPMYPQKTFRSSEQNAHCLHVARIGIRFIVAAEDLQRYHQRRGGSEQALQEKES